MPAPQPKKNNSNPSKVIWNQEERIDPTNYLVFKSKNDLQFSPHNSPKLKKMNSTNFTYKSNSTKNNLVLKVKEQKINDYGLSPY